MIAGSFGVRFIMKVVSSATLGGAVTSAARSAGDAGLSLRLCVVIVLRTAGTADADVVALCKAKVTDETLFYFILRRWSVAAYINGRGMENGRTRYIDNCFLTPSLIRATQTL